MNKFRNFTFQHSTELDDGTRVEYYCSDILRDFVGLFNKLTGKTHLKAIKESGESGQAQGVTLRVHIDENGKILEADMSPFVEIDDCLVDVNFLPIKIDDDLKEFVKEDK